MKESVIAIYQHPSVVVRKGIGTCGRNNRIDAFCYISCRLHLGSYCHISSNCTFLGGNGEVSFGDFVNIAPGCRIISAGHDYKWGGLNGPEIPEEYKGLSTTEDIRLGNHVLIGSNTVVLPGVELPEGVAIGALSLVPKGIYRPWTLYAGIPVRELGPRDRIHILESSKRLMNELNPS